MGNSYSTISSSVRPLRRAAEARTTVRRARAIRPWRPITLPTSSLATWSCRIVSPSRSSSSTRTASGSSTRRRARYSTRSADTLDLQQARDRLGRLRALREPVAHLLLVELDRRRLGLRVVATYDLEELAVARRARVRRDDPVDRVLLRPDTGQPQLDGQTVTSVTSTSTSCACSSSSWLRSAWAHSDPEALPASREARASCPSRAAS